MSRSLRLLRHCHWVVVVTVVMAPVVMAPVVMAPVVARKLQEPPLHLCSPPRHHQHTARPTSGVPVGDPNPRCHLGTAASHHATGPSQR